jgi:hypothetical protein
VNVALGSGRATRFGDCTQAHGLEAPGQEPGVNASREHEGIAMAWAWGHVIAPEAQTA